MSGVSLRDAAFSMGVSPATLSRVENGKGVNTEVFARIVHWLVEDESTSNEKETTS